MLKKTPWVKKLVSWQEGTTAYISVSFSWLLPEAKLLAQSYIQKGYSVRIGGPGAILCKGFLKDVAVVGGEITDVIVRHNPMATRASYGCPVGCWFCLVPKLGKELKLVPEFPVRPILCDDNLSALPLDYQDYIIKRYAEADIPLLDANSGFEPATFTVDTYTRWKKVLKGPWRFGYDEAKEGEAITRVLNLLKGVSAGRKQIYVMIGHEPFDLCMERITKVIEMRAEPYVQPFIKLNALVKEPEIRHDWTKERLQAVQRWVNRHLWRYCTFTEYQPNFRRL